MGEGSLQRPQVKPPDESSPGANTSHARAGRGGSSALRVNHLPASLTIQCRRWPCQAPRIYFDEMTFDWKRQAGDEGKGWGAHLCPGFPLSPLTGPPPLPQLGLTG